MKNTDRELLELAAKAIGYTVDSWDTTRRQEVAVMNDGTHWQPLHANWITDCDGDALRLVIKLKLPLDFATRYYFIEEPMTKCSEYHTDDGAAPFIERHKNDAYAATRRAIVRAAAEVGRSIK